jgi:hypothetical protein
LEGVSLGVLDGAEAGSLFVAVSSLIIAFPGRKVAAPEGRGTSG